KANDILDHLLAVLLPVVRLAAFAVSPAVERDHPVIPGERGQQGAKGIGVAGIAVYQHDRLAAAFDVVVYPHAVGGKDALLGAQGNTEKAEREQPEQAGKRSFIHGIVVSHSQDSPQSHRDTERRKRKLSAGIIPGEYYGRIVLCSLKFLCVSVTLW